MEATLIVIDSDAELARARALVDRLMTSDKPAEFARLTAQARLIAAYEEEKWPARLPSAAEVIRYLMDQRGLKRADLVPLLGSADGVDEILRGRRQLTLAMVQRLRARLPCRPISCCRRPWRGRHAARQKPRGHDGYSAARPRAARFFTVGRMGSSERGDLRPHRMLAEEAPRKQAARERQVRLRVPPGVGRINMLHLNAAADHRRDVGERGRVVPAGGVGEGGRTQSTGVGNGFMNYAITLEVSRIHTGRDNSRS